MNEAQTQSRETSSQVSGNTIGTTTVSSTEANQIRDEVRSQLRKMFPDLHSLKWIQHPSIEELYLVMWERLQWPTILFLFSLQDLKQ